jgi:ubiquinone/menaquinone biosynthesis C-methylase UbiE
MHAVSGPAVPYDYDDNPQRFLAWQPAEDVHESVAERVARERLVPVLDLGCGDGRLARTMRDTSGWIGVDISTTLLALAPRPVVHADALHLPFRSNSIGVVATLWMLYHFTEPTLVIAEAHRILRPGGVFVACFTGTSFNILQIRTSPTESRFHSDSRSADASCGPANRSRCRAISA